jgi:mercuric reductase
VDRDERGFRLTAHHDGKPLTVQAEQVLVATGRRPVTDGLGLEEVGVHLGERGEVRVDAHLRTSNPRIWAAGDVTGHPQFVYVAAAYGTLMVDNAFGQADRALDYRLLPRVTFTSPQIAAVGLTDQQAPGRALPASAGCSCWSTSPGRWSTATPAG